MDSQSGRYRRRVYTTLQLSLTNVSLPSMDYTAIRSWVNRELPRLQATGYTSYIVFGSCRGSHNQSLRIAQYELGKPTTATVVVLGDTPPLELTLSQSQPDALEFKIKFHLLTGFADRNVAIYEKNSVGEAVELELLRHNHCFAKTVVFPRDRYGVGGNEFETKEEVLEIARYICFADDLDETQKKLELRGLIATAHNKDIQLTEHELTEFLDEAMENRTADEPSYSWAHLALFQRFERVDRCHTWHTDPGLREAVNREDLKPPAWGFGLDSDTPD